MQSKADIQTRLKADLATRLNGQSSVEGTFNKDMIAANSIEFEQAYAEMDLMIEAGFADTSWGKYLTMRAAEFGVIRKEATKAIGKLKIVGEAGASIIKGSLFTTAQDIKFYSTADNKIGSDGTAIINIEAGTAGTVGIVEASTIINIPMSIPNVVSCTNEAVTYDGFEEETDAELLARYLLKVRTPATSGNKYHYLQWATDVAGVGSAKVIPLWAGKGTVKVIIINGNNETASEDLIKKTFDYIEDNRPIGATLTVTSPTPKAININADVKGTYDIDKIKISINSYFKENIFNMSYISIAQIGKLILESNDGTIKDYNNLRINNQAGNISLTDEELPAVGEVILYVLS
jgi:uncharacterized phage protein gp47/JayE